MSFRESGSISVKLVYRFRVVLPLVFVLHMVLRNHFAVALHVAMFVVGTLFVTNIQVKKPRNSTLAVLVGVVALAILKIFHIF